MTTLAAHEFSRFGSCYHVGVTYALVELQVNTTINGVLSLLDAFNNYI